MSLDTLVAQVEAETGIVTHRGVAGIARIVATLDAVADTSIVWVRERNPAGAPLKPDDSSPRVSPAADWNEAASSLGLVCLVPEPSRTPCVEH